MAHYVYRFSGLLIAAVALAGCGGTAVAPDGGGGTMTSDVRFPALDLHGQAVPGANRHRTWMAPEAKSENLMYISDGSQSLVYVYSYPKAKQVGTIGMTSPLGICSDSKGDIWIASVENFQIVEYAHGGTKPIRTVSLPGPQFAYGCSVDPTTGNLAVTSFCEVSFNNCISAGSVFVYTNIKKAPTQYYIGTAQNVYFCGYDGSGNLFVDAYEGPVGPFELGELAKGASSVQELTLNRPIYFPGGVQWDGKYIAVGDQSAGNQIATAVHQLTVKGTQATVVGTTPLHGASDVTQFWIQGKTIVAPNYGVEGPSDARVYAYPAGGTPLTVFGSGTFDSHNGSVVSVAGN